MRAIRFSKLAALVLLGLSSCGLNEFDVTQSGSTTISGGGALTNLLSTFPSVQGFNNFDFSQAQDFKNQNAQKSHVSSAKVKSFTLKLTAPNDESFGFLDTIAFFVEANGNKVRVAHKENIASLGLNAPNPTLTLDLDDQELADFVKADTMTISTEVNGRQPTEDTTVTATIVFHVAVSP